MAYGLLLVYEDNVALECDKEPKKICMEPLLLLDVAYVMVYMVS